MSKGAVLDGGRRVTPRPPPGPLFQIRFLKELQRILEEGRFTATYKFALVHALADLSVQMGRDTGDALRLHVSAIARRFTELYWRQVAPWPGRERAGVLAQNTGQQAEIVRMVKEARRAYGDRIDRLRAEPEAWGALTARVRGVVRKMPLLKLQTVGGEEREFLYENRVEGRGEAAAITLKPGIAYCFRSFHPLVVELAQGGWAKRVRRANPELIGERTELREFLFGAPRANLEAVRGPLVEIQGGRCFYCERAIGAAAHVDHFVPWSRYPVDLGHNFVATHDRCNEAKADHLSAEAHLARWAERHEAIGYQLEGVFERAGIPHDREVSRRVTEWAYAQVEQRRGLVWVKGRVLEPLGSAWRRLLRAA
jgi:hypothetical protein